MISIIISSTDPVYLSNVQQNIKETIGVPYEVISVNNGDGQRGLCEIYNSCAVQARYELLCFMHEDLKILTTDWGLKVIEIFNDEKIGLLGVAGADYKALTPTGWACPGIEAASNKVNIVQRYKYKGNETNHEFYNANHEVLSQVASIDGVWMCTRKEIALERKFDEGLLKQFHGYDIDFSLNVASSYAVVVTYDVLLEHFSEGDYSADWLDATLKVNYKYKQSLPLNIGNYDQWECRFAEKSACKKLLKILSGNGYGAFKKLGILWKYELYRVLGMKQFILFQLNILISRY